MQFLPRLLKSWHGLKNSFIQWKNIIEEIMWVRWIYCPCRHHIRLLLLHPWWGRTRLCNLIKMCLIHHHCCRKQHVCLNGHTRSTQWRKNPRIFHMGSAKDTEFKEDESPPKLDPIITTGAWQLKVPKREGYIPTPTLLVASWEWSIIGTEAPDDALTLGLWNNV